MRSVVGDVRLVSMPDDQAMEPWLQFETGEMTELILLIVLVVDLTEELGERFLLRAAGGGTGRGCGACRNCSRPWVLS